MNNKTVGINGMLCEHINNIRPLRLVDEDYEQYSHEEVTQAL